MKVLPKSPRSKIPDRKLLWQLYHYDPLTGDLYNQSDLTKPIGTVSGQTGNQYLSVTPPGCTLLKNHRVIWKMMTGDEPYIVDHKNGERLDNRWVNLRESNYKQNNRNAAQRKDNRSGVVGVHFDKGVGKWKAQAQIDGRRTCLLTAKDFFEVVCARKAYEAKTNHKFGENHARDNGNDTRADYFSDVDNWKGAEPVLRTTNKSGVTGVHSTYKKGKPSWVATCMSGGKRKHLYQGVDFFKAVCARKSFEHKKYLESLDD